MNNRITKGKTSFAASWLTEYTWIEAVKNDIYSARCKLCKSTFKIDNSGITTVKRHADRDKHKNLEKNMSSQRTFLTSGNHLLSTAKTYVYSDREQVIKAEILQALKVVESNQSFASANGDNERFRNMFPDSVIAKSYSQSETKLMYNILFGIAPHIKALLKADYCNEPFTFKFDETTTSQIKKQYDAYITFFSKNRNVIITSYCGSLFVGHCTADDLVDHFFHFLISLELNACHLLGLGMDGPNVNKSFEKKLATKLKNHFSTSFISMGSCALHTTNNAFGEGIKCLKAVIDLDQFAIDMHFFFKYSSARREDYAKMEGLTSVVAVYLLRHCSTRWLSIDRVLVRIIEQFDNLYEYFINQVPLLKHFKQDIKDTARYQRIKKNLTSKTTLAYMSFVVYIAHDFKKFIVPFQTREPMIHMLHIKMLKMLQDILLKFVDGKHVMNANKTALLPVATLLELDVRNNLIHKPVCDIGTKAKSLIHKIDAVEKREFERNANKVLVVCAHNLLKKLPIDEQVIYDARFLHPLYRQRKNALNGVNRLTLEVAKVLGKQIMQVYFKVNSEIDEFQLCDIIQREFTEYQTEIIPPSFYVDEDKSVSGRKQVSYWEYAYDLAGIIELNAVTEEGPKYTRIEKYWLKVYNIIFFHAKIHIYILNKTSHKIEIVSPRSFSFIPESVSCVYCFLNY